MARCRSSATTRLTFGGITIPGGWRRHPVVVAQAIATLGEMFPGRVPWVALGSGEALNECVIGTKWPSKATRNARLEEAAHAIRALLNGQRVSHDGELTLRDAQIWSRPVQPTHLMGAALSAETAGWVGDWADGLLTVGANLDQLKATIRSLSQSASQQADARENRSQLGAPRRSRR